VLPVRIANVEGRAHVLVGDRLVDIERGSGGRLPSDPMEVLARMADVEADHALLQAPGVPLSEAHLGPPIPRPSKILAAGGNYQDHIEESPPLAPSGEPNVFAKLPSALVGPTDPIVLPAGRGQIDWEVELVVVIARRARDVPVADAWGYVAGVTGGQDISDRAEQVRGSQQWTMAKSFDTFAPTGPYLVTVDELADRDAIGLQCFLDEEEVQDGTTANLLFPVPVLISWASHVATLEVGDLFFTGTPGGVGAFRDPPRWLEDGQVLRSVLPGVGEMANPVRRATGTGGPR
jgi:2,4-diketo-3-deoxy-L-fuconate hydrolase